MSRSITISIIFATPAEKIKTGIPDPANHRINSAIPFLK